MMSRNAIRLATAVLPLVALTAASHAYEFRVRWVERIGDIDVVIGGDGAAFDVTPSHPRRIRLQFGVFEDAAGPPPAGGFMGWTRGELVLTGGVNTRTPGRLTPFNFGSQPNANGVPLLPEGDPFLSLAEIDCNTRLQFPMWECAPDGTVPPQPGPIIFGHDAYISVFEFTTDPAQVDGSYTVTVNGELRAAVEWRHIGTPYPPECNDPNDPHDDVPGYIDWYPLTDLNMVVTPTFTMTINVVDCAADFNDDARVDSGDFFDFLQAFFLLDPAADFDASGAVDSADFFAFLQAFFASC
jgi:hypothetical protein